MKPPSTKLLILAKILLTTRFVLCNEQNNTHVQAFLENNEEDLLPTLLAEQTNNLSEEDTTHFENDTFEENSSEQNGTLPPPPASAHFFNVPFETDNDSRIEEPESRALTSGEDDLLVTTNEPVPAIASTEHVDSEGGSTISKTPTTSLQFTLPPADESSDDDTVIRSILHHRNLDDSYLRQQDAIYQKKLKTTTSTSPATTAEPQVTIASTSPVSTRPTSPKRSKTMKSYKSRANDVLRKFVENEYLRTPLACVVDTTNETLRKAQILWMATLRPNAPLDMILAGYNASGML